MKNQRVQRPRSDGLHLGRRHHPANLSVLIISNFWSINQIKIKWRLGDVVYAFHAYIHTSFIEVFPYTDVMLHAGLKFEAAKWFLSSYFRLWDVDLSPTSIHKLKLYVCHLFLCHDGIAAFRKAKDSTMKCLHSRPKQHLFKLPVWSMIHRSLSKSCVDMLGIPFTEIRLMGTQPLHILQICKLDNGRTYTVPKAI